VSSRCQDEATNFLALNLAMEIVSGAKSPEQARRAFADAKAAAAGGTVPPEMQGLRFPPAQGSQADPDVAEAP
jgi:hypothetical protein